MLDKKYLEEITPDWINNKNYKNRMSVPKIDKVVVNIGYGNSKDQNKEMEAVVQDLRAITGQNPVVTQAKKSIAGFSLQKGMNVGAKVTLRNRKMYDFLDKLFNVVLPRLRDFRGLSTTGFDGQGNYSLGLSEQIVFLEIDANKASRRRGIQVTISTTAKDNVVARELLVAMGLPLRKEDN